MIVRPAPLLIALACAVPVSFAWALMSGSAAIPLHEVWGSLTGSAQSANADIVTQLRLPRALAAFAVGGLLALAGALVQVLVRNPLAEPYLLGISGGASVGALLAMMAGLALAWVNLVAAVGALAVTLLVLALARRDFSTRADHATGVRLILTGVIVASGTGAVIATLLALAPDNKLKGMLFWLMGDFNGVNAWGMPLAGLAVLSLIAFIRAKHLNLMARGNLAAHTLGVRVGRTRLLLYALCAAATALAVTTAGSIGFIGLIVPHALRLLVGNDQRVLLPGAVLAGGALLMLADTLARTIIAPQQLPVGVMTSLIGVPVFLWLLSRGGNRA